MLLTVSGGVRSRRVRGVLSPLEALGWGPRAVARALVGRRGSGGAASASQGRLKACYLAAACARSLRVAVPRAFESRFREVSWVLERDAGTHRLSAVA